MTEGRTITEVLAGLIFKDNLPPKAVILAAEAIAIDARLSSYQPTAKRLTSFETMLESTEAYEELLQGAQSASANFSLTRDGQALVEALSQIKEGLVARKKSDGIPEG